MSTPSAYVANPPATRYCPACGYDLRGMTPETSQATEASSASDGADAPASCPECGWEGRELQTRFGPDYPKRRKAARACLITACLAIPLTLLGLGALGDGLALAWQGMHSIAGASPRASNLVQLQMRTEALISTAAMVLIGIGALIFVRFRFDLGVSVTGVLGVLTAIPTALLLGAYWLTWGLPLLLVCTAFLTLDAVTLRRRLLAPMNTACAADR
ncbi:MAG: hypothetical protein AAF288_07405 [Planctomycetota bacterium]